MVGGNGSCVVAFNGEIYNYRNLREELEGRGVTFRTNSDTEVLLESYLAWGLGCLDRLEGMFALAIFDTRSERLFLARDRAGEKPLYIRRQPNRLTFASELKSLFEDPSLKRVVKADSLDHYLAYGYAPTGDCIIDGIEKLPPGFALELDVSGGRERTWRYWDLPLPGVMCGSLDEAVEQCESLLTSSVRQRLVADVPVGVLLSGGIDSSLVAAVAARVADTPIRTFTVTFPGHGKYDEAAYASAVARSIGSVHTELVAREADESLLRALSRQFDEPIADHSIIPTFQVCRLLKEHVTVALGGDGGDELFGGYPHYSFLKIAQRIRSVVPSVLRAVVASSAQFLPPGVKGRNHLIGLCGGLEYSIAHFNVYFDSSLRMRLLGVRGSKTPEEQRARMLRDELVFGALQAATRMDFRGSMAEDYLVKVDRASMLASLELRAPFLDRKLVEFAFSRLPDEMRVSAGSRKIVLRKLVQKLVPIDADWSRKQGFSVPLGAWMQASFGDFIRSVLTDSGATFPRSEIDRLFDEQARGRDNANRIFALVIFELWRNQYGVSARAVA
jgi:asparagine synthase (glutamine-hydrolysing)